MSYDRTQNPTYRLPMSLREMPYFAVTFSHMEGPMKGGREGLLLHCTSELHSFPITRNYYLLEMLGNASNFSHHS